MDEGHDYLDDYFKIVSPKGAEVIKEKIKSIIDTTKNPKSMLSTAIKIPAISNDNGAVEYYEILSSVKEDIKVFISRLNFIESLHLRILSSTTPEESKENLHTLNVAIKALDTASKLIYDRLKELSASNAKLVKHGVCTDDVKERIKQHTHTSKAFLDATAEFRIIQNKYKDKYKERVKRHISITKPDATPQEIELYAKKLGDSIDQADTITAIVTQQSVNASLEQAKSQNKEILELEHNISDLYHLFNEMSTMLSVQNDYITGSEEFIQKANKNANLGIRELHTGVKYHKRSKKKIMYIVISVITAIFFFLAMSLVKLQA